MAGEYPDARGASLASTDPLVAVVAGDLLDHVDLSRGVHSPTRDRHDERDPLSRTSNPIGSSKPRTSCFFERRAKERVHPLDAEIYLGSDVGSHLGSKRPGRSEWHR